MEIILILNFCSNGIMRADTGAGWGDVWLVGESLGVAWRMGVTTEGS